MNKKILFLSALLVPTSVNAAIDPEVYIGGTFNFNAAAVSQDSAYDEDNLPHELGTSSDSNNLNKDNYFAQEAYLDFLAIGRADNNVLYGATATLMLDSKTEHQDSYSYSSDAGTGGATLNRTDSSKAVLTRRAYVFAEKKTSGRIEAGDVEGPSKKMKFDAGYRFGGTGGIAGNWWKYVNIPSFGLTYGDGVNTTDTTDVQYENGKGNMGFIIRPDLPLAHGYDTTTGASEYDDTRTLNRLSYYSPRMSGVQVGISYVHDSGDRGASYFSNSLSGQDTGDVKEIVDWGINYLNQGSNFGFAFSLTGEHGVSEDRVDNYNVSDFNQNDLSSFAFGLYGYYGNLEVSGSVGTWGDSLMFVREDLSSTASNYRDDEATYITAGFGYQFSALKLSVATMASEYRQQEFSLTSVALDYRMTKYLTGYIEFNDYQFTVNSDDLGTNCDGISSTGFISPGTACENAGNVIIVGAKVEFGGFDNSSQILLDTSRYDY